MNALELEDIKMQFNQKVLFENLDLAIEKGTITLPFSFLFSP